MANNHKLSEPWTLTLPKVVLKLRHDKALGSQQTEILRILSLEKQVDDMGIEEQNQTNEMKSGNNKKANRKKKKSPKMCIFTNKADKSLNLFCTCTNPILTLDSVCEVCLRRRLSSRFYLRSLTSSSTKDDDDYNDNKTSYSDIGSRIGSGLVVAKKHENKYENSDNENIRVDSDELNPVERPEPIEIVEKQAEPLGDNRKPVLARNRYSLAYLKALHVAKFGNKSFCKSMFQSTKLLTPSFTFSYFIHTPSCLGTGCMCKCRDNKSIIPKNYRNINRHIFGNVKVNDYLDLNENV
jgi:hypothetical protein